MPVVELVIISVLVSVLLVISVVGIFSILLPEKSERRSSKEVKLILKEINTANSISNIKLNATFNNTITYIDVESILNNTYKE